MPTKEILSNKKKLSYTHVVDKVKNYCAYQERCHSDIKKKLSDFGLSGQESDNILAYLIENQYLNEQRFADQFVGGHFRIKRWGRVKIRYALRQKQISEHCIKKAMQVINEEDYLKVLNKLFEEKKTALKGEKNHLISKKKILHSLLQKGFERDYIMELLKD
jgi:regulatory protein